MKRIRRLQPDVLHVFDTNFVVLAPEALPPLKHVPTQSRWITDTVRHEVFEQLGSSEGRKAFEQRFQVLDFSVLYRIGPRICPVYYWFVLAMYNPANVGSESFAEDMYVSRIIKNSLTDEERKQYQETVGDGHRLATAMIRAEN